jgi:transposase
LSKWPRRKILNAMSYLLRSGCQWRMLAREFPPWSTVHHYFRMWRKEKAPGRKSEPSAGSLSEQEDELRDYERLCQSSQAMIYAVMRSLMLRRLTRV